MPNGSKIIRGLQILEIKNDGEELEIESSIFGIRVKGQDLPTQSDALHDLDWQYDHEEKAWEFRT